MKFTSSLGLTMSGSSGGVTASRNRGGQYFRRRAIPTNPNTPEQQTVRSSMTTLVASWQGLSVENREGWATYAENTPRTDPLGQVLVLTGQQQYIANNTQRIAAGLAVQDLAPTDFNRGNPATGATFDSTTPEIEVLIAGGASFAGNVLLYVSRPLSPAKNFFKGPYRLAETAAVLAAASQVIIVPGAVDPYGASYQAGQSRSLRVVLAYDDGRVSEAFESIVTLT